MLGKCFMTISQNVSQITHLTLGIQAAAEPSINIDTLFFLISIVFFVQSKYTYNFSLIIIMLTVCLK